MAGYLPGILMGLSIMVVCAVICQKRRGYRFQRPTCAQAAKAFFDALPSLLLVIIVMGGIMAAFFTATEGPLPSPWSTFILSVLIYREVKWRDLPKLILESVVTTSIVLLLIGGFRGHVVGDDQRRHSLYDKRRANGRFLKPGGDSAVDKYRAVNRRIFMDMTPAVADFHADIPANRAQDPGWIRCTSVSLMMVKPICVSAAHPTGWQRAVRWLFCFWRQNSAVDQTAAAVLRRPADRADDDCLYPANFAVYSHSCWG